jgi:capsular polysaccharide biosynthesis protein
MSAEVFEGEHNFSFEDLLRIVRTRLWVILVLTFLVVGATVALSLAQRPIYEASIEMLVGQERGITETPNDALGLQQLTRTMAVGVDSRRVASVVIREEGLDMSPQAFVEQNLEVEQIPASQFIEVT